MTLVAVGFEQVTSAACQRHGAIVRAERRGANQPSILQMFKGSSGAPRVASEVVKIGFGNDAKRADGRWRAAFGAVDFVDVVALADRPTLQAARQVEVLREHLARVTVGRMIAPAAPTTAPAARSPKSFRSRSFDERGSHLFHIRMHVVGRTPWRPRPRQCSSM